MKKLLTLLLILILVPIFIAVVFKRVPPATIGVKQSQWGGGIIESDYETGFHVGISGYHKWHFLPATTHFIHFTDSRHRNNSLTDTYQPALSIRTSDKNLITYEVSVSYRIKDGEAWRLVADGVKIQYQERVGTKVTSALRDQLNKLSSEDLQLTERRMELVEEAMPFLVEDLAEFHCTPDAILIRRFGFQAEYEQKLQDKQFLRQKALLDFAETKVAEEEKKVNLIERQIQAAELSLTQTWEKTIQEKKSEYEVLIAGIRAEASVYAAETMAKGDADKVIAEANGQLALEKAEALRNELRTAALNSEGGRILLALDAAENLDIPRVTLNSDDPNVPIILNLGELTKMLVGD